MSEVMKPGAGQPGRGAHQLKRFSQTLGGNIALAPLRTREEKAGIRGAGVVHLIQKPLELWREVRGPMPPGFGVATAPIVTC